MNLTDIVCSKCNGTEIDPEPKEKKPCACGKESCNHPQRDIDLRCSNCKQPTFLSSTSVGMFFDNKEQFYLRYIAKNRPKRDAQTKPMSVGSAFDAYVKHYLATELFGDPGDNDFDFLFPTNVEEQNRDWARKAGKACFDRYRNVGAARDLLGYLNAADANPSFETELKGEIGGVPFKGYPDLKFNVAGCRVILDWKVNGYCSKSGVSPDQGYAVLRTFGKPPKTHKLFQYRLHNKLLVNDFLKRESWERQLSYYAWLLNEPVGGDFVLIIHQLACRPQKNCQTPNIRVAEHQAVIPSGRQHLYLAQAQRLWKATTSGHIFDEETEKMSLTRCKTLEMLKDVEYPFPELWR